MQRFDCLALNCPLFGPHLLEASAGTGKTFSIEHIFVRLVLESVEVEQILAVTFTRAATRELKARIRGNLEKALIYIKNKEATWEYLQPHLGSSDAIRSLTDALAGFDRCQIFTIHGFCYRVLKEFAFEAKVGSLSNPDEGKKIPESLRHAADDFLESGIERDLLCPEQLIHITKQFESVEKIADRLLYLDKVDESLSYSEILSKCKAALHEWKLVESKLREDFQALEKGCKATVKGNFDMQVRALVNPDYFGVLLKEKGSLFKFLSKENRKVKAKEPDFLNYPGFFEWASIHLAPLLQQKVLPVLQAAWTPVAERVLAEEEYLDPDEILVRMKAAFQNKAFVECIRKKYPVAIIDEFQDTDEVQWEIFKSLFLDQPLLALYLVGDPKQSIYRFRKADVYTYLKARDFLGEEHLYQLDTNFRSSKPLIGALNALFSRNWLHLPKVNRTLPFQAVKAGAEIESNFSDEKGALHFFVAEGEPSALFDDLFLPFVVKEIETLNVKNCAILVKDRYQSQRVLDLLKKRGIAAVAKSHIPLGKTVAFQSIRELFAAILAPRDPSCLKIVMAGPFAKPDLPLAEYKNLLEEKGLVPFARKLDLDSDSMQIFELLFAWEKSEGFSFEGLNRYMQHLQYLEPDEGGRRRMEVDADAVQIMTLHISKGLEFDVVFALGLSSRTPESEEIEELDAEKLRQLYVAMTRAKKRLYVPIALSNKNAQPGTHSPMELFSRHFEGSLIDQLSALSKSESITIEHISSPFELPQAPLVNSVCQKTTPLTPRIASPFFLSSFTSLAKPKDHEVKWTQSEPNIFTMQTMPRGPETGIIIHKVFEMLFSSQISLWKNFKEMDALVEEQVKFTPLENWKSAIQQMVRQTMTMPMIAEGEFFSLIEIEQFQVEMEFVFSSPPNFVKGFIDLVFYFRGKVYFLDWKTNWLEDYGQDNLQKAIDAHDYGLQAALYAEAIKRHFQKDYGGAYYLFVRGGVYWKI
ncbi:MAG: hypothetical protein COT85_06230 [Chlamydiae bacterium CG10_big_fil_rev_8_21_14_0_10_42_34]|nr:MAG: hypothetical protein COT85_06230 [Chlamydiae bacterium CG10_big_fil_rev_8_21_14_0_10_42_34]